MVLGRFLGQLKETKKAAEKQGKIKWKTQIIIRKQQAFGAV